MKLCSWNVNGLRACVGKGFGRFVEEQKPDILCLQETKLQEGQLTLDLPGYRQEYFSAERPGYSGTAVFTRVEPLRVTRGLGAPEFDAEGRVLTAEYPAFTLVTVYTPNAQPDLRRIAYREAFEDALRAYLMELDASRPVIVCGDMNVARSPLDLKNPKPNEGKAGYSPQERAKLEALLQSGFCDTFRRLYPDRAGAYTWWSYRFHARERNAGWRIDYFLCSERLMDAVDDSVIYSEILGSDHCPIGLTLRL